MGFLSIYILTLFVYGTLAQGQFRPAPIGGQGSGMPTQGGPGAFQGPGMPTQGGPGVFQGPGMPTQGVPEGFPGPTGWVGPTGIVQPPFGFPQGPGMPPGMAPPMSPMAMMMSTLARNPNNYRYATCTFNDTWTSVKGRVDFRQFLLGEGQEQVQVRLQLAGLPVASSEVERGIHVHDFGDIGGGCSRVGPHFNPNETPHGSQRNIAYLRHVGDLGNIRQSTDGKVSTQFVDTVISLGGDNDIVGRSFVIKLERDDEGLGGTRDSRVNGNTRTPIACCVIGRTTAANWYNPLSAADIQNMAMTGLMPENRVDPFAINTNSDASQGGPDMTPGPFPGQPGSGFPPGMVPQGGVGLGGPTGGVGQFPGTFGPGAGPFGFGGQTGIGGQRPGFGGPMPGFPPRGFPPTTAGGQQGFGEIDATNSLPGSTDVTGFGPQGFGGPGGFGPVGFGQGQPGAGRPFPPTTVIGAQGGQGFQPQGGFTQGGFPQGGLTQNEFSQGGFQGFSETGGAQGPTQFRSGTFTPGAAQGQTFNFNQQGKKK